jgi:fibronectin-binding autotransporter adhesin
MNITSHSSRGRTIHPVILSVGLICLGLTAAQSAAGADKVWSGGGPDRFWQTGANWVGGVAPVAGDSLFFGGTVHTTTTNDFGADTLFNGVTFSSPAGFFTLSGNEINLGGNLTNNQVVTPQTVSLPLVLTASPLVDVVPNGELDLSGVISGGGGLTTVGGGLLSLSGANTFSGGLTIDAGTVAVGADTNLGAGNLTVNGGRLETTASFALNPGRGIAVGPGWGGIKVDPGTSLSYGGVIADNGGSGALVKNGYGSLTLSGANTYTGSTSNRVGTLTLDFTQAGSPVNNIIPSTSDLTLGGENAGLGGENEAELNLSGKASTVNSQTFNSTHLTFAASVIRPTSGTGGQVTLNLGTLSHDPGGTLLIIPPAAGAITTSPGANLNGLLGGWATIGNGSAYTANGNTVLEGTNYAAVDGSGNIVNFNNYFLWSSGNLAGQVTVATNLLFKPSTPSVITVDNDNAGTVTTVNTLKLLPPETGTTAHYYGIYIGPGNTLRLGQYGGILKDDFSEDVITIGGADSSVQTGSGETGSGDIGTITAGGADNTPGEIVMDANAHDESHGTTIFEATIADNGLGKVTFVKTGPGSIKLDGHNTFSGGLYLLQGRVQFAGSEIGQVNDAQSGGTGPIYILPGSYLFPSGIGTGIITNSLFVAGSGDAAEPLGAFRGGRYSGPVTLIGDATFGGGAVFDSPINGPFNVTLGSPATINGGVTLNNTNAWTGDTTMTARNNTGNNTITSGTNNVIPFGFGVGNVILHGYGTGTVQWDLNGFNQQINGLSTSGTASTCSIINNAAATTATLAVGDNNQSGTFGGVIEDGAGQIALTKIGGGDETLTGSNAYTGSTLISSGTLDLSGSGSIADSTNVQVDSGATLDVSGSATGFATTAPVTINGGTLIGNAAVGNLSMSDGALTLDINPSTVNETATGLTLGGTSNVINIASVSDVPLYPVQFTIIQYAGTLNGAENFVLGAVPNSKTAGYISNDVADSRIVLVLTSGPASLTWTGNDPINPTYWDLDTTVNWLAFKGTIDQASSAFEQADSTFFDDTAAGGLVDLRTNILQPSFVTVSNNALNYTFTGAGALTGPMSLTKSGSGTLTLMNTGGDSYSRGVAVNGGLIVFGADNGITGGMTVANGASVQVGQNAGTGTLPGGNVDNEGSITFDRGANLTAANAFSGAGTLTEEDADVLTLSGDSGAFTGPVNALAGTLKTGSGTALGTGTTTISSGATLDVNGQSLTNVAVIVSGTGVGGLGAIINSGADSLNALGNVTLAGDTTFGGTGRWDIRGGAGQLSTGGNPYNLTKIGTNQVSLVGVTVDGALANINVQSGTFSVETTTTGLGNSADTLTLSSGATLQLYNSTTALSKQFALNGDGATTTLNCGAGVGNTISASTITLTGNCVFNAASGTTLTFTGGSTLSGGGSYLQTGAGTNIIASSASATYTGGTTVSNGTLDVDGNLSGTVQVDPGATLAGIGTASGNVTVQAGSVWPGDQDNAVGSAQGTLTVGALTLSNATAIFRLDTTPSSSQNDHLAVNTSLALDGTNTLEIAALSYMNVGDIYTLVTYGGATLPSSATNNLRAVSSIPFFSFSVVDPSTTPGAIEIKVLTAVGNDFWTGAQSPTWDNLTTNWTRNSNPVSFVDGDVVNFDDSSTVTGVSLSGTLPVTGINVSGSQAYTFGGTGTLTGPGGLNLNGLELTIANAGTNSFTGPITIASGILQVGNGGTTGNLGSGTITNDSSLVFNRSDNGLTLSNAISGSGSLTNIGTGTVTLAGASTFAGDVTVAQGTIRVLNSAALSDTTGFLGSTYVSNGAALDIGANTVELGAEPIYVSGAGVGGTGAILDDSRSTAYGGGGGNFYNVTLLGDTTFGGSGRMDMRNTTAIPTLYTGGQPYALTKVGTNQFEIVGAQVDPGLGNINVVSGLFGIQGDFSLGLGNPADNLTVFNGADFDLYDVTNGVSKVLILQDGATVSGSHGACIFNGPVTLSGGTNIFNVHTASLTFTGVLSGPGNLDHIGGGTLVLANAAETYTGNTYIDGGSLALMGTATIATTPMIFLGGNILDASASSGATFTLAGGQALVNGGFVLGALVADAGSTINPGGAANTATLNDDTSFTLNGSVLMNLNRNNSLHLSDKLAAPGFAGSGATLTVTNVGPDLETGDTFHLFSTNVTAFTTVNLPAKSASGAVSYTWQNNIAVDGSIKVLSGAPNLTPTNLVASVNSGQLTLSWPANHIGWTLQVQTNTIAVGLSTNWTDVPGSTTVDSITVPVGTTNGAVFYRLTYQP